MTSGGFLGPTILEKHLDPRVDFVTVVKNPHGCGGCYKKTCPHKKICLGLPLDSLTKELDSILGEPVFELESQETRT